MLSSRFNVTQGNIESLNIIETGQKGILLFYYKSLMVQTVFISFSLAFSVAFKYFIFFES